MYKLDYIEIDIGERKKIHLDVTMKPEFNDTQFYNTGLMRTANTFGENVRKITYFYERPNMSDIYIELIENELEIATKIKVYNDRFSGKVYFVYDNQRIELSEFIKLCKLSYDNISKERLILEYNIKCFNNVSNTNIKTSDFDLKTYTDKSIIHITKSKV